MRLDLLHEGQFRITNYRHESILGYWSLLKLPRFWRCNRNSIVAKGMLEVMKQMRQQPAGEIAMYLS
jgi:hypothetical protein